MTSLTIRPERDEDFDTIREVVVAAFESESEGNLIDDVRASDHYMPELSLVAERDGEIVGHVMVSRVQLVDDDDDTHVAHSLAPVAVRPDLQSRGIGAALVRTVVDLADELALPMVLLEGSPRYYGRFGFEHSVDHGIHFDLPDWAPPEAAQVRRLTAYDPRIRGRVRYPPAFHAG